MTGLRTGSARLRAVLHLPVLGKMLAVLGTAHADFCARFAGEIMEIGVPNHEIRARPADIGAIEHEGDMRSFRVFSPFLEAVDRRFSAHLLALQALLNALLHFGTSSLVSHATPPCHGFQNIGTIRPVSTVGHYWNVLIRGEEARGLIEDGSAHTARSRPAPSP